MEFELICKWLNKIKENLFKYKVFIENFIFTSVILLSDLVIFSIPDNIFCITFSSFCIIKFFSSSIPKESKKKKRSGFDSMSSMLHQCIPSLSELSVFAIKKGCFSRYHIFRINKFVRVDCWKNTNKIFHYIIVIKIFNCLFYLKIWYFFRHFASYRAALMLFLPRS